MFSLKRFLGIIVLASLSCSFLGAQSLEDLTLYKLLRQMTQFSNDPKLMQSQVRTLAESTLNQLQALQEHLLKPSTDDAAMVDAFFKLWQEMPVTTIEDLAPRHIRALNKTFLTFEYAYLNTLALERMHAQGHDALAGGLLQVNAQALMCLQAVGDLNAGFWSSVTDNLIFRPVEAIKNHPKLSVAAVLALGTGACWYFTNKNSNKPEHDVKHPWLQEKPLVGITLVMGDITQQTFGSAQDQAAVVNAANAQRIGGGGVDGAMHTAAGPELAKECAAKFKFNEKGEWCPVGQARLTEGHNLAPLHIIHTVGPDTRDKAQNENKEVLLRNAYLTSCQEARKANLAHIAFLCISTVIFGYDHKQATPIAVDTIIQQLHDNPGSLKEVRFVVYDKVQDAQEVFDTYLHLLRERCIPVGVRQLTARDGKTYNAHCFHLKIDPETPEKPKEPVGPKNPKDPKNPDAPKNPEEPLRLVNMVPGEEKDFQALSGLIAESINEKGFDLRAMVSDAMQNNELEPRISYLIKKPRTNDPNCACAGLYNAPDGLQTVGIFIQSDRLYEEYFSENKQWGYGVCRFMLHHEAAHNYQYLNEGVNVFVAKRVQDGDMGFERDADIRAARVCRCWQCVRDWADFLARTVDNFGGRKLYQHGIQDPVFWQAFGESKTAEQAHGFILGNKNGVQALIKEAQDESDSAVKNASHNDGLTHPVNRERAIRAYVTSVEQAAVTPNLLCGYHQRRLGAKL